MNLIGDPLVAIWAAISAPFAMRAFVAWTVGLRIRRRGPMAQNRVEPLRERSDYPPPNDWLLEFGRMLLVLAIALPVAFFGSRLFAAAPTEIWPALCIGSAGAAATWAFRRIRADDRLTLTILAKRLQIRGESRLRET